MQRRLEGEWLYLWLDATYVKVRKNGRVQRGGNNRLRGQLGRTPGKLSGWASVSQKPRRSG